MPIIDRSDAEALQEILYQLDPSLTFEEVPEGMITARSVLRAANRWVLSQVDMTETEYDALPPDDLRREVFEEVVIKKCASELITSVAQLVSVNANGLMTRFQEIDWKDHQNHIDGDIESKLKPYLKTTGFYSATSQEKRTYGKKE